MASAPLVPSPVDPSQQGGGLVNPKFTPSLLCCGFSSQGIKLGKEGGNRN